ncbi:hypothetical protein B0H15DRAFT_954475 [Mycena belliarum]|uniref:Uncharacterized protein n=1 Tax=Mycena belliarum TaxID=1033014 RepID=A0AAD6TV78_9AGAR|nr:hypothetical protein B0H15DRAFT_954471 [Mycena belliae]KAJ7078576.1 hypothetical protein B0H15DRAFT_954475 [Mycena belliae]
MAIANRDGGGRALNKSNGAQIPLLLRRPLKPGRPRNQIHQLSTRLSYTSAQIALTSSSAFIASARVPRASLSGTPSHSRQTHAATVTALRLPPFLPPPRRLGHAAHSPAVPAPPHAARTAASANSRSVMPVRLAVPSRARRTPAQTRIASLAPSPGSASNALASCRRHPISTKQPRSLRLRAPHAAFPVPTPCDAAQQQHQSSVHTRFARPRLRVHRIYRCDARDCTAPRCLEQRAPPQRRPLAASRTLRAQGVKADR